MTWYSQAGQDEWVHSIVGDDGFFVDVGAYDGVEHSNTYALETEHGWHGIAIEPQAEPYARLRENRRCAKANVVIGDRSGYAWMQGDVAVLFDQPVDLRGLPVPERQLRVQPLTLLLDVWDVTVDYLSIDVEGWELEVLAGMNFERWPTRLITIEHNAYRDGPAHKAAIHSVLTSCGFERVVEDVVAPGYGPYEDWYRNPAL